MEKRKSRDQRFKMTSLEGVLNFLGREPTLLGPWSGGMTQAMTKS